MTRTSKNGICLLTCFSNVNLMLGCCVFKKKKKKFCICSSIKKTYNIINISSIQNNFTFSKCTQPQSFPITHKKISQNRTKERNQSNTIYFIIKYTLKKEICTWCCKSKRCFNSVSVMLKPGLCSNNKLTATSIVSLFIYC